MIIGIDARALSIKKPAGIATYLRGILNQLQDIDKENEYILYSNVEIDASVIRADNFRIKTVKGAVGSFWLRFKMPKVIKKDGVTVFWGAEHVLPRRKKGITYVLTVYDLALFVNPSWGQWTNVLIQKMLLKPSVKQADRIIAISGSTKNDIVKYCGKDPQRIEAIYSGASYTEQEILPADIEATKEKYKIHKKYFLYLGTIEPRKNIKTVVRALEIINKEHEYQFVVAGQLGWKYQSILSRIAASPCREDIVLTGYVSRLEKEVLFHCAEAFLFPSHYEGFGIPIIEAMHRRTPVITARNSSLAEVGGDAAFYADDENDAEAIAKLMRQCAEMSSEERQQRIKKGQDNALRFSWEKCAREVHACLTGSIEKP